jgi:hypothetical protein
MSVAVIEEEREPDEWCELGRLVSRKLLRVEGPFGRTLADHHRSRHSSWRLELGTRIGVSIGLQPDPLGGSAEG